MRRVAKQWLQVVALVVSGVMVAAGCATTSSMFGGDSNKQTFSMDTSPQIPGAQGTVQITSHGSGNRTVELKVEHLPPPDRVFDGTSAYIVWLIPADQPDMAQNMGLLAVGDDLKGKTSLQTTYRNFDIVVTAETDANTTNHSRRKVMNASIHLPA